MSREGSPASSLDYFQSDEDSDDNEYAPGSTARATPSARGGPSTTRPITIKLNLSAVKQPSQRTVAEVVEDDDTHPYYGGVEGDGDGFSGAVDLSSQDLKPDHQARPLWVDEHGNIILEAFAPLAQAAQDFLIAIAEPVSRPSLVHEYRISKPSLHAAMSVGLETSDIIEVLERLSKIPLPLKLRRRIESWTSSYGKIRLVLKHNRYFLESSVPEFLRRLLNDEIIGPCRVVREDEGPSETVFGVERGARRDYLIPGTEEARRAEKANGVANGDVAPANGRGGRERDDVIGAVIGIDESELRPRTTILPC